MFLNQSSDIYHICDEIESICAYLYQLDEAVLIYRDNIMNGDVMGLVLVLSEKSDIGQLEEKMATVAAQFLGKHIEE